MANGLILLAMLAIGFKWCQHSISGTSLGEQWLKHHRCQAEPGHALLCKPGWTEWTLTMAIYAKRNLIPWTLSLLNLAINCSTWPPSCYNIQWYYKRLHHAIPCPLYVSEELQKYLARPSPVSAPRLDVAAVARPKAPPTPSTVAYDQVGQSQATTVPGTLPGAGGCDGSDDERELDGMDIPPVPASLGGSGGKAIPQESPLSPPTPVTTPGTTAHKSEDGTVVKQPVIPEPGREEDADDLDNWDDEDEIPELSDALAPKPKVGQHSLSPEAIRSRSIRIFTKRSDGSKKVSEEIWADWHSKGPRKKLLEDIFRQCGYCADTWVSICYGFQSVMVFSFPRFLYSNRVNGIFWRTTKRSFVLVFTNQLNSSVFHLGNFHRWSWNHQERDGQLQVDRWGRVYEWNQDGRTWLYRVPFLKLHQHKCIMSNKSQNLPSIPAIMKTNISVLLRILRVSQGDPTLPRQRIAAIKKHCRTQPKKLCRTCGFQSNFPNHCKLNSHYKIKIECANLWASLGISRKDTYEKTRLYYVELAVKGSYERLAVLKRIGFRSKPSSVLNKKKQ